MQARGTTAAAIVPTAIDARRARPAFIHGAVASSVRVTASAAAAPARSGQPNRTLASNPFDLSAPRFRF